MSPACSESRPRVGLMVSAVGLSWKDSGREPYCSVLATRWASLWVKGEICASPEIAPVLVGAVSTMLSSRIAVC